MADPIIEIRDKLASLNEADRDIIKSIEHQNDLLILLLWLIIFGIILQLLWIVIKVIIDFRQERRFRTLTDIASEHGDLTDQSKRTIFTAKEEIANGLKAGIAELDKKVNTLLYGKSTSTETSHTESSKEITHKEPPP